MEMSPTATQECHRPPARVRLRTHPPLTPLQAWVPFSPSSSIIDLKASIVQLLAISHQGPLSSQDIVLELDGFAFLDQSPCSMIDAAHDLIDVKTLALAPSASQAKTNRKRSRAQSKSNANLSAVPAQPTTQPLQPSTSQPVVDATQLANSRCIKPLPTSHSDAKPALQESGCNKAQVPPGQGSATTKARNKRKRLKKLRERQLKQAAAENSAVSPREQGPAQLTSDRQDHVESSVVTEQTPALAKGKHGNCPSTQQGIQIGKPSSSQLSSGADETTGSSTHDSQSSTASDSESDSPQSSSTSDSGSNSSPSDSASQSSDYASSAPSSASVRPPTALPCPPPFSGPVVPKTVPIAPNPHLNMLSLSNKNKRKNLRRGPYAGHSAQPSKIVFHSSVRSPRPPSPLYEPPSPSRSKWSDGSPTAELCKSGGGDTIQVATGEVGNGQAADGVADELSLTLTASRSHGPPPSMRPAKLIPPNLIITCVDVLDPSWTAGQIGHCPSAAQCYAQDSPAQPTTSRKNRERNRKKKLKRRRRADNSKRQKTQQTGAVGSAEESGGDTDLDDEGHDDMEAAFTEFMSAGGHNAKLVEMNGEEKEEQTGMEQLADRWQGLEKVDQTTVVVGQRIAIQTIGLCLETFTPETVMYYGTLLASSDTHLSLQLDPACIPSSESAPLECDGGWDEEQMDTKEAMRAQQRDALRMDTWGEAQTAGAREWQWSAVSDARKI